MTGRNASNDLVKRQAKQAAAGHNSESLTKDYLSRHAGYQQAIEKIRGEEKAMFREAKKDGESIISLRKAYKKCKMTEEQLQAHEEIEAKAEAVYQLCKNLPLWKAAS